MYCIDDYDYHLPDALIAQQPSKNRGDSRLLYLQRRHGQITHCHFQDLLNLLDPGDILVINDTKVIPGRLHGRKSSGGKVEALILNYAEGDGTAAVPSASRERVLRCLVKSSKPPRKGTWIQFNPDLKAQVIEWDHGIAQLRFLCHDSIETILQQIGSVPLPPYIKRGAENPQAQQQDRSAYQTVYAAHPGAIAAPTAGLHFSSELINKLSAKGIDVVRITLHVGYGTFMPLRVTDIRSHKMHAEWYHVSPAAANHLNQAKQQGRRIIAVGTTSVRTLEYHSDANGLLSPGHGSCDLFIYPGYQFKLIDGLITNFHLPRSTLVMLVAALAGRETILSAYRAAIKAKYRFFSYGDAMLIL